MKHFIKSLAAAYVVGTLGLAAIASADAPATAPQGEGVVCHRKELPAGEFVRTIALPFEVEEGKVLAKYDKGVLAITLPRAEKTKPKTIPVIAG